MKKHILIGSASVLLLFASIACNREEEQIRQTAYDYSYAVANYDLDKAEGLIIPEASRFITTARHLISMLDSNYIKSDTPATIEITDVDQTSDTSALATYHKVTPIKDFSDQVELVKRDGRWLVVPPRPKHPKPAPTAAPAAANDSTRHIRSISDLRKPQS